MIVMKFGGTSVGTSLAIQKVINIVKTKLPKKPIVVVSAISEATNTLEHIAQLAANKNLDYAQKIATNLQARHLKMAKDLIAHSTLLDNAQKKISYYFAELNDILKGIALISELSNQSAAKIYAYGELLSSTLVHGAMLQQNLNNALIDAREIIITDDTFLKGKPNLIQMNQVMPELLKPHLDRDCVILTQGFIASNGKGITTVLGREGSDYSASLIGNVMDSNEIQIWTDVDGIMTADPRKIQNTQRIPEISFKEAEELSFFGAKVIHPLTVEPAAIKNIPVRILNTNNPKEEGTLVTTKLQDHKSGIKSIAYKEHINFIGIDSLAPMQTTDFLRRVFNCLHDHKITIDAFTASKTSLALAIDQKEQLADVIEQLQKFAAVKISDEKSLICLIGNDLLNKKLIIKNILQTILDFQSNTINLGSSETNMTLLVDQSEIFKIIQKLHDQFCI